MTSSRFVLRVAAAASRCLAVRDVASLPSSPLSPKRPRDGNSPAPKAKASRTACYQPARAKENDLPALPSFSECDSDECAHSESDSDESDSDE